jgi:hypothetical protein
VESVQGLQQALSGTNIRVEELIASAPASAPAGVNRAMLAGVIGALAS